MARLGLLLLAGLLVSACTPQPDPAKPALWQIAGPNGERGWLFGTIHSLPRPAHWRSPAVGRAFAGADRIVVEVADLGNDAAMAETFARLARSPGQPPLSSRVAPKLRERLTELLDRSDFNPEQFGETETWAAALMLARIGDDGGKHGIDRAVIEAAGARPVVALEGAAGQLGIFDALPEKEQRDLLALVVGEAGRVDDESERLARTWRQGDMAAIEAETHTGLLADPELRQALFTDRNRAWTARIVAMLARGERPFVAVGAAHMAGAEGLPAMLEARGYRVKRIQ